MEMEDPSREYFSRGAIFLSTIALVLSKVVCLWMSNEGVYNEDIDCLSNVGIDFKWLLSLGSSKCCECPSEPIGIANQEVSLANVVPASVTPPTSVGIPLPGAGTPYPPNMQAGGKKKGKKGRKKKKSKKK